MSDSPVLTRFEIEVAAPFRLDLTVWALRRRPTNAVDRWDGNAYGRTLRVGASLADVRVVAAGTAEAPRLDVSVATTSTQDPSELRAATTQRLGDLLGLGVDLTDFYERAALDPDLGGLVQRFRGVRPPRFPSVFEGLVNAVACQQLSIDAGISMLNRLSESFGSPALECRPTAHAFPDARVVARLDPGALRPLGFSARKALAIVELAERLAQGEYRMAELEQLGNDEVTTALRALRGVGRWSAEYVLLRTLGRLDVFPGDDVGARNNLRRRLGIDSPLAYDDVRRITSRWSPYSGLVYFHFLLANLQDAGQLDPMARSTRQS